MQSVRFVRNMNNVCGSVGVTSTNRENKTTNFKSSGIPGYEIKSKSNTTGVIVGTLLSLAAVAGLGFAGYKGKLGEKPQEFIKSILDKFKKSDKKPPSS